MWLYILALYHDIYTFIHHKWKKLYFWWNGSQRYYLTYDEQVLPFKVAHSSIYCPLHKTIYTPEHLHVKRRPLPWLGISVHSRHMKWDMSEWISDIRVQSTMPSLSQMIRLASLIHKHHVPQDSETKIHVINRMGEEEEYVFDGTVTLVKK